MAAAQPLTQTPSAGTSTVSGSGTVVLKRKPELLALLESRGRKVPDQIGSVGDLLDHYGFATEAEAKSSHDRLVAEKLKKGYSETAGTAAAPPAAPWDLPVYESDDGTVRGTVWQPEPGRAAIAFETSEPGRAGAVVRFALVREESGRVELEGEVKLEPVRDGDQTMAKALLAQLQMPTLIMSPVTE